MKNSRLTVTQIIAILKSADAGLKVKDLRCAHGISETTYNNRKSKHDVMERCGIQ